MAASIGRDVVVKNNDIAHLRNKGLLNLHSLVGVFYFNILG